MNKATGVHLATITTVLVAAVIFSMSNLFFDFSKEVSSSSVSIKGHGVLIIDAGHGGFDPGAVAANGTEEKDINLAIALKLRDLAEAHGIETVMLRSEDVSLENLSDENGGSAKSKDIHYRANIADSFPNAVYVSIHQNAFSDKSQHGTQVFYGRKDKSSSKLATSIMAAVTDSIQPENKREIKPSNGDIYILENVYCPMVLVECGFITNDSELASLCDPEYQLLLSEAILSGYLEYISNN